MVITGFHAIEEKILSTQKKSADSCRIFYSKPGPRVKKILAAAAEKGIAAECIDGKRLDDKVSALPPELRDHRGIVLEVAQEQSAANLIDFDAWLKTAGASDEKKIVLLLDHVTDPHNTGAILRSCDQFGVSLVLLPEHNSASDIAGNEVIARASAGASAWVPVAVVSNLVRAAERLKDAGFWVYGADAGGENCTTVTFAQKAALVMGSEGSGISRLLGTQCDSLVSIPTCGRIDSLNVSVAAGILLYEAAFRFTSRQN